MELDKIKILVDKYFDGITSLEEEQELAELLAMNNNLPEEYLAVKMMLSSFEKIGNTTPTKQATLYVEKSPRKRLIINKRWVTSAAAVAGIILGVAILLKPDSDTATKPKAEEANYICYVNGTKVEDDQLAYAETTRILGSVSEDIHLALEEINRLTHYTIAK